MEAALHADSLLAAGLHQPLSENSHQGHQLSSVVLYPGIGFVNSNTATGMRVCLYDEGRGSRCTGKERDAESGLDYFGARYYGSALGRFTSPDWSAKPEPVPYAKLEDPQSLNLYSYVRNGPLSRPDLDGHDDYYYDQSGKLIKDKTVKHGKLYNFFLGDTHTMNTDDGKSYELDRAPDALGGGQKYTIVSAATTQKLMDAFLAKQAPKAKGMSLSEFKANSPQGQPFDFKKDLSTTSLYLLDDGVAHARDWVGNRTWGYLAAQAGFESIAHYGAGFAQWQDRNQPGGNGFTYAWCLQSACDEPRDYQAIEQGFTDFHLNQP